MQSASLEQPSVKLPANEASMLILDYKLRVNQAQQNAIDEAIRTVQFIRNKALRLGVALATMTCKSIVPSWRKRTRLLPA